MSSLSQSHQDNRWSQGRKMELKVQFFHLCHVTLELFIGPPWKERETRIRESPDVVPTGITTSSQTRKEVKVWLKDWEALVWPQDLPSRLPEEQDNKVIWMKEERGREQDKDWPTGKEN
jgi:hypothetical protein